MKHIRLIAVFMVGFIVIAGAVGLMVHTSSGLAAVVDKNANQTADKIGAELLEKFQTEGQADFIVRFTEQADLTPAYSMDWNARGEFVVNALKDAAERSQVPAKALLDARGLKNQTFIAGNELYVWSGDLAAASELAALVEVASIRETRTFYIDPVDSTDNTVTAVHWAGDLLASNLVATVSAEEPAAPDALAWGITDTKADQFWTAFGVQGDGIKVANIDTGVQWNHPALDQAFACPGDPTNPDCWADPSNICGAVGACDNNGHGTHTMGTMVGDDDPGLTWQAGMAPNANWIACKGCETNSCSDFALNACADWILQPGGDPANRPHVVNNSWGGGGGDAWYLAKVQAWRAAGTYPAFSAGNAGPSCNTLGSPGDYQESFGSAAHDSGRNIAGFSSRGPSAFGHDPYTKPNISAPGVSVCSSVPTNSWSCGYSGTSMASPHSAGAVALLWSCNPTLIGQLDLTFEALQNNANAAPAGNCGAPPDGEGNYTFGYGYLDVLASGTLYCGDVTTGWLDGHVYDTNGDPIEGASVNAVPAILGDQKIEALTDPFGYYTMTLIVGTYDVTASKANYTSQTVSGVEILTDTVATQDFSLSFLGSWTPGPAMCFDLTRIDAEYFPATEKVYIMGGRGGPTGGDTIPNIYSFDPATGDCVDTGALMPNPVSNYTINLVNNGTTDLLCTFGGRAASGTSTLDVQCYDPIANSASIVTTLPAAYTGFTPGAQVVYNNQVYVFGGFRNTSPPYELARTDRYDPVANSFTQLGDLSLARSYIFADVVDGMIYAFGGTVFDGTNLTAQTRAEVMADPEGAGTWDDAAVADLPTASAEGRAFGFDGNSTFGLPGQIVLAGGGQWPDQTAEALVYDVASDTYDTSFPDLINARRDHAGATVPLCTDDPADGLPGMWVFGGRQGVDTPPYMPAEFFPLECGIDQPNIVVEPASLEAGLFPDQTTTRVLTITNEGNVPLEWSLSETEGLTLKVVERTGVPERLGPTPQQERPDIEVVPLEDVIADGSFEAGTPNPYWEEYSTNFGTPLCTVDVCGTGTGTGPRTGLWWAWFGGIAAYEEGTLTQTVILSEGAAQLSFWLEQIVCDSPSDYLEVLIDGTQVFYTDGSSPACGVLGYQQKFVDVSAWADGNSHDLVFHSEVFAVNADISNFFVDDVVLDNTPDIEWLSESPISGTLEVGETQIVTVTFDSTGLTPGVYTAGLLFTSNDPDTPQLTVPVTLTVWLADVDVDPNTDALSGDPGTTATYTLQVANLGNHEDTFDISASLNTWVVNVLTPTVTLPPNGVADVTVEVEIPLDALAGASDDVTITATSQGYPEESDSSVLTTTANQVYGVELTPETAALSGSAGERVEYTLTLNNTGNGEDTFDITALGTWNVHLPETSVTVAGHDSVDIIVHVDIPAAASQGDSDDTLVEVTSQGDPTVDDSSVLTTTAEGFTSYLPIVFK